MTDVASMTALSLSKTVGEFDLDFSAALGTDRDLVLAVASNQRNPKENACEKGKANHP